MTAICASPLALPLALRFSEGDYAFDLQRAARIWQPAGFSENRNYPHCSFTLTNPANGTKVQIAIGGILARGPEKLYLQIHILTSDCPLMGSGRHQLHQHLATLDFHDIEKVEFPEGEPENCVRFHLQRAPGRNPRSFCIFRGGRVLCDVD